MRHGFTRFHATCATRRVSLSSSALSGFLSQNGSLPWPRRGLPRLDVLDAMPSPSL